MVATNSNSINYFSSATWVVSPTPGQGTDTTITTALTRASSGQTIFIMPGTYTENITLKAGVNLTAFECDDSLNGTGNVIISGTCTMTTAGTVTISGIQLQTNSAIAVTVSGTAASILNLNNCYINVLNNTGLILSSSNASSGINLYNCKGNVASSNLFYSNSGLGTINFYYCVFKNSGGSANASRCSGGGVVNHYYSTFDYVFQFTSSSVIVFEHCNIYTVGLAVTSIILTSTSSIFIQSCNITSDAYACLTVNLGCLSSIYLSKLYSTAAAAITGSGSCTTAGVVYQPGSSFVNNVTTQNAGTIQGIVSGKAVNAGFLGEQFSVVQSGNPGSTSGTIFNVTSFALTRGIWDVSANINFFFSGSGTVAEFGISTTSAALSGTYDNYNVDIFPAIISIKKAFSLAPYRINISATTTIYLCARGTFTTGGIAVNGCLRANRVG